MLQGVPRELVLRMDLHDNDMPVFARLTNEQSKCFNNAPQGEILMLTTIWYCLGS